MITIYHVKYGSELQNHNLEICLLVLIENHIQFVEFEDAKKAMQLSHGLINPRGGFVMETRGGEVLLNYFDLVAWIEKNGLRLI